MIKLLTFLTIFITTAVLVLQGEYVSAVVAGLLLTYLFGGVGLLFLGLGLDAYFSAFSSVPYFSVIALGWYVISELLQSKVSVMRKTWVS